MFFVTSLSMNLEVFFGIIVAEATPMPFDFPFSVNNSKNPNPFGLIEPPATDY